MNAGLSLLSSRLTIGGYAEHQYDVNQIFNHSTGSSDATITQKFLEEFAELLSKKGVIGEWHMIMRNIEFGFFYDHNSVEPSREEFNKFLTRLYEDEFEIVIIFTLIPAADGECAYFELDVVKEAVCGDDRECYS